jgi:2-hydroxychromene-2-carboxylate isomerase
MTRTMAAQQRYEANTRRAIDAGVFGAPGYVIAGEIFWASAVLHARWDTAPGQARLC